MRSWEFITEALGKRGAGLNPEHKAVMSNLYTFPDQNMNTGNGHYHSRFLIALAGAGAGNTPDENMPKYPWDAGDVVYTPYAPEEEEMLDRTAKHMGDNSKTNWGNPRSEEPDSIHKVSPITGFKGYKRK
jgi:hypothetical protein